MKAPLRVGLLAGEMSGDILGAGLMAQLRERYPDVVFSGMGGERMAAQGLQSLYPMDRLSVMGLVEPLRRLPELLRMRRALVRYFVAAPPDVFIGIDSPDFCLDLELQLRKQGIPTVHYVSPSVWAWRRRRIHKIAHAVDLMLCLFPFEARFYEEHGVAVKCVGHPLADDFPEQDLTASARAGLGLAAHHFVLALLPGSRHGEVARLSRPFLQAARQYCAQARCSIILSAANPQRHAQLQALLDAEFSDLEVQLLTGGSREVMAAADFILLASGTATLEALLLKKPMVVCYRMSRVSYAIISRLIRVPYFSLPNLLARQKLVPELVQDEVNADMLGKAIQHSREHPEQLKQLKNIFTHIHQQLKQDASRQAADAVLELIWQKKNNR